MEQRRAHPAGRGATASSPTRVASAAASKASALARPARAVTELHLVQRVFERCHRFIRSACEQSSVPPEFLGALVANESAGDPTAARFEPSVYRHLKAVSMGRSPAYGGFRLSDLAAEVEEILHPKAQHFHARYLIEPFGANHREKLAALEDDALRELATSWGFTQIMGYHMVGRGGAARDLLEPSFNFRVALELLAEFAAGYQLDLSREFEEMFRCWNTGAPYGETFDPHYARNGLRRLEIYRSVAAAPKQA